LPLNKLDNFIKNTEGRILYVSPADLDSTDSIDNTGNSLARPFKTIQRALLESARFSYVKGNNNDHVERTTILLMPGDHDIDNRPGFRLRDTQIISPSGTTSSVTTLDLNLNTNFDLTQEDNILYKFNSVNGGVIVPRGTSIVGLDLRKTKIRPLYVPNPTDDSLEGTAIFRITGACYFWQFSIFDGNENATVYTDKADFTSGNKSKPIFSHHKLTCFEYADGVNLVSDSTGDYALTDLDMYYGKLSNAYGTGSGSPNRNIDDKYPSKPGGFAKQRPEFEIVGAFASDPISINSIEAGSGGTPSNIVTVTTATDHGLSEGTPIKINGVVPADYNIATKVQNVTDARTFTYLLPVFRTNLTTPGNASGATVTIETDTVSGASPYIFNISLRSVYGMNGMHADGSKADGFRSMVVAQFTGVSLQKDDRAFVKYNKTSRSYDGVVYSKVEGASLSNGSSQTDPQKVYHLDSQAVYRRGWEQTHIKISQNAILQIVSVFAIGYNKHFVCESGGDASITNSNSNFGQLSLISDGFRKEAFAKDNKAFITNIFTPRSITSEDEPIDWLNIDVGITTNTSLNANASSDRLYLAGFESEDNPPLVLTQGYRIGAKVDDKLFVTINGSDYSANILIPGTTESSYKEKTVNSVTSSMLDLGVNHGIQTGEKIVIISDNANYPENIIPHVVYYAIALPSPNTEKIKLASTKTDAENGQAITIYGGTKLKIQSRVTDKIAGDIGHPVQWDSTPGRWYVNVNSSNTIYSQLNTLGASAFESGQTEPSFFVRNPDPRSLDEKIYKFRVVIPKELTNGKTPEAGFIIQESSTTNARNVGDFTLTDIDSTDYEFERNPRFISTCTHNSGANPQESTVITELPHNLNVGDHIIIRNVTDTSNAAGAFNSGYNGSFSVKSVSSNNMEFTYVNTNITKPGSGGTNDTNTRTLSLPRYERNNIQSNFYVYRNEIIDEYIQDQQDGVYHVYALRADVGITTEFTDLKYSQNVTDLYPQLDRDNPNDSPTNATSYALSSPIGDVHTSNLKGSITRDTANHLIAKLTKNLVVDSVLPLSGGISTVSFARNHGFNGVIEGTLTAGTSNRNAAGTYYNVKLLTNGSSGSWDGATAKVTLTGSAGSGTISAFEIQSTGSGYASGNTLYFDTTDIGGSNDAYITLAAGGIISNVGDVVQITGISTIADAYYRIDTVPDKDSISIGRTTGDPSVIAGQIVINTGPSIPVSTTSFASEITTFTCSDPHGLVAGNKFKVIDTNSNNLGDFIVASKTSATVFTAKTTTALGGTPTHILKHFLSANSGVSDASNENIASRGNTFYGGDVLNTTASVGITTTHIPVSHPNAGISTMSRFPLGSYIQIEDEIMRVASSTFFGTNKLVVIRGALATEIKAHDSGSLVKKINPLPVEFRRPSIIRASGHTFEYLGYGPGNYSTGLPQVQTRTLTEREEFLSQAQERSSGIVVYTGMNNRGDFYIGNTKKSSATGEETSFDTPIPTITGADPARLSAIFDEVTIKERIVVEGGDSQQILSQFDGPVNFGKEVRIKDNATVSGVLRIKNTTQSNSTSSGSLIVSGGAGIAKNLYVGGYLNVANDLNITGSIVSGGATFGNIQIAITDERTIDTSSGDLVLNATTSSKVAISTNTEITGTLNVTDDITAFYTSDERLKDNVTAIDDPLAKVLSLGGYTFDWNENTAKEGTETGVIAQEVESLGLPGLVTTRDNGYLAVHYEKLVPLLIEAVKELSSKVDALEQRLQDK